jgi:hypothetical protein
MPWWLTLAATLALALAAAKAHGRQVRLEREQQGFFSVDFRRKNPPGVEAIWRSDRRLFWPVFAVLAAAILALLAFDWSRTGIPPGFDELAIYLGWAFAASFVVAGLVSWVRLTRREGGDAAWHRSAYRGSIGWWALVAAAAALVAATIRF